MDSVASIVRYVLVAVVAVFVVLVLLVVAVLQGLLSPFGLERDSADTQVVDAVTRTQEVSLLSLAVQGIKTEERSRTAFGVVVPGSNQTVILQYEFDAKLGIDGAQVEVEQTGEDAYLISVPAFTFIGYDEPTFKVAANNGGVLSFVTPEIDSVEMVNEVLDGPARTEYLADNERALRSQTRVFYDSLISAIDPDIETTYEFRS